MLAGTDLLHELAKQKPHPLRLALFWLVARRLGFDLQARFGKQQSPLHVAAQRNNVQLVKLLLALGADVHARNGNGTDALAVALAANAGAVARLLVHMGFDVHVS